MSQYRFLSASVLLLGLFAHACSAFSQATEPWTVDAVVGPTEGAPPPEDTGWSPDGKLFSYVQDGEGLVAVDAATGKRRVLARSGELDQAKARPVNEKDADHRARYSQPGYFWSPDGKQILFDEDGTLWLLPVAGGTLKQVGDTQMGSGDDVKWSPDGSAVSFLRGGDIYVLKPGAGEPARLTSDGSPTRLNGGVDWVYLEELSSRSNYAWAPDSAHLAYVQMDEAKVPEYPLVDWIPTLATTDHQRYPQPGTPNPAVRLGVVAAAGGETRWVDLPVRAGDDYIPRLGWVNAHTVWAEVLRRDHQHREIVFADIDSGQTHTAWAEDDAKYLREPYDVTFLHGSFVLQSWRDGWEHLYRYTFDADHPLAAEAKLAGQLESGDYSAEHVLSVDEGAGVVFYASTEGTPGLKDDSRHMAIWAASLSGGKKRLVSGGALSHSAEFAPGHASYADRASNMGTPPVLRLCDATETCHELWRQAADTRHRWNVPVQLVLKAADGTTTLYATLVLPQGATGQASVPLITNPYGGPGAHWTDTWGVNNEKLDQLLSQHGFAVLHVDNRGEGGRSRAFEQAAWHDFQAVQLADQLAAIDQVLGKYPQLDGKRLGWWGWSWGGTFTLNALTHSDRFRAGVSVAPVTDFRDYDSIYTERYLGLPAEQAGVYDASAVQLTAARLHGALLIMHGTGDDNVHMENTVQFVQKLIDAGLPYDLQIFPRKTHSIAGPAARRELYARLLAHFERYMLPTAELPPGGAK